VRKYFHKAKEHWVKWQLHRSYCLTYTPGRIATQFNWHGNEIQRQTVNTEVLSKFRDTCSSMHCRTYFLLTNKMENMEYNGGCYDALRPVTPSAAALLSPTSGHHTPMPRCIYVPLFGLGKLSWRKKTTFSTKCLMSCPSSPLTSTVQSWVYPSGVGFLRQVAECPRTSFI